MDDSGTVHGKSEEAANGVYFAAVQSELADEVSIRRILCIFALISHISTVYRRSSEKAASCCYS
jgi:hypothetical protein